MRPEVLSAPCRNSSAIFKTRERYDVRLAMTVLVVCLDLDSAANSMDLEAVVAVQSKDAFLTPGLSFSPVCLVSTSPSSL
jgi:hypothetical protein